MLLAQLLRQGEGFDEHHFKQVREEIEFRCLGQLAELERYIGHIFAEMCALDRRQGRRGSALLRDAGGDARAKCISALL